MQSSRKTLGGPSRSDTEVVPRKNTVNPNVSSAAIKGLSKSISTLNKVCFERPPARAASSSHVRPRTLPSLPRQPSRSHERLISRTSSKTRGKSVSRPLPSARESGRSQAKTRKSFLDFFRTATKSDRHVCLLSPKGSESDRVLSLKPGKGAGSSRKLPKDSESDRNFLPKAANRVRSSRQLPKGSESDRSFLPKAANRVGSSRQLPKGSDSERNFVPKAAKSKESSRLLPKGSDSNRIVSRPFLRESALDVGRLPPKSKEIDHSPSRLPFRSRNSDRNLVRPSKNNSAPKVRDSDRNLPSLPARNRDSDRNIPRPETRGNISDRNVTRPTIQTGPTTKRDKTRDLSQPPPKADESVPILAPASTSTEKTGQASGTRLVKQKSSLAQKCPPLTSPKIFSQLSLKKLSLFAFRKKAPPKKTASILKDTERPPSAPIGNQLDEGTHSSGPWTESVGTSTKPPHDCSGAKPKPPSQTGQEILPRPADCLLREEGALVKLSFNEKSKKHAGQRSEPVEQHDENVSVGSFVDCPEKPVTLEYECFCRPEESPEKDSSMSLSGGSRESSSKPKGSSQHSSVDELKDVACSPEMPVGEPKEDTCPPEENMCPLEDAPKSLSTKESVCSAEVSIGQADPCFPKTCSSPQSPNPPNDGASQDSNPEEDAATEKQALSSQLGINSPSGSKPKTEVTFKRSQSQVDSSRQSADPTRLLLKRGSSPLKLTRSECICVPVMYQDGRKEQISSDDLNTLTQTAVTTAKTESVSSPGSFPSKFSNDKDFCSHKVAPFKPDIYHPGGVRSVSDLEAVREALAKESKGVIGKAASQPAPENRRRGEPASGNVVTSSALQQGTPRTSKSCTGTSQHQLSSVEEAGPATGGPVKVCCSEMREPLVGVSHGRVSKPPPVSLTSYPEEPSRGPQSRTESLDDSGGSTEARIEILKPAGKKEASLKDDFRPEEQSTTQCKSGNGSSDTVPPPDASNLSSDVSQEKERSASSKAPKEIVPAASRSPAAKKTLHPFRILGEEKSSVKQKSTARPPSLPKLATDKDLIVKSEHISKVSLIRTSGIQRTNSRVSPPIEATVKNLAGGADECKPTPSKEESKNLKDTSPSGEKLQNPKKLSPHKESSGDEQKRQGPSGKPTLLSENSGTDRLVCLPQRRGTAESNDSASRLAEQAEALRGEEGTAARCQPITKLKLKKEYKEPTQSDLRDIQEDIRIWKDLYAGCLERLRSLQQMNQVPVCTNPSDRAPDFADRPLRRNSNNGLCNISEIKGGMDEAVRVLESEYGHVESALRKHSAVLAELVSVLQNRMSAQPATSQAEADQDAVRDVKDGIHYLKALITENETLTMQLAAERAKQQVLRQVQVTNDAVDESISATEDKLHRTNSLFKMQMKRLQYEMSRLTEAHSIELKAGAILVEQAEADVVNDLEVVLMLQESNERLHELLSSKRFVSGQRVFNSASRGSFLSEEVITSSYCSVRRDQLEYRLVISDRVQRNVDLSNDEIKYLHALGRRMCNQIYETNEEIRKSEFAWHQLRKERDELTKELYPDLERLQKMQDVAKEKLDLESKLRKENMLFRHQLEEFQRDLLEVETELMSGSITRRTEATKNKVVELETLYENAKLHNSKLREECDSKNLTISRHDSLASLSIDEEEFQRQISEKIQRMELRIQADMDRRLLRPKRYVLEAPGKSKVSFRGQRNVIKAPKNVAEWRRKREVPQGVADPPKPQQPKDSHELRREILAKLAEEKERAKEQLLRYEAHHARHTADATTEPNAHELNELLGRLGRFLNQTRAQEASPAARPATSDAASLHGGAFGETLMHLIVQLDQLQSALTVDQCNLSKGEFDLIQETTADVVQSDLRLLHRSDIENFWKHYLIQASVTRVPAIGIIAVTTPNSAFTMPKNLNSMQFSVHHGGSAS